MVFKSYINPDEAKAAHKQLPKLMVEGLLMGGTGLGVLALIFEIAADAFSVAAYQTLLAIHGANGYHDIAIAAFMVLSVMLFLGIVPAYKAGAYLRPNAGGSGPLVEAIGPPKMRWLSWIGTSLFFLDAVLTIIISSISAADVTMLLFPEFSPYRILIAESFAFFIMAVLVAMGPKRAVPLFLLGGAAFTIFTIIALTVVAYFATANPEWAFLADGIVSRLQAEGVVPHVIRAQENVSALMPVVVMQLFFRSMSSAMLGFGGYEVIPASGKHAARPKWKVISVALTLAAVFLIGTGVIQLYAARQWNIPSTEGYSTLLIEYEVVTTQVLGKGVNASEIIPTAEDYALAEQVYQEELILHPIHPDQAVAHKATRVDEIALGIASGVAIAAAQQGTIGVIVLAFSSLLLSVILLLAQGGGYIGGAAVASNAARLGRLPRFFLNDRWGIFVIWLVSFIFIPIIREVVVVEAYYAFGFVSAFAITSTTVFFVRNDVLMDRGIEPGSGEAKSLKFAGFRGMIASYAMAIVLVTQKTEALGVIVLFGATITAIQLIYSNGGLRRKQEKITPRAPEIEGPYASGIQRAIDETRQRAIATLTNDLIVQGEMDKFNVSPESLRQLVAYVFNLNPEYFQREEHQYVDEHIPEPSIDLEVVYNEWYNQKQSFMERLEYYSHYGIFTFIDKYYHNWVNPNAGRDAFTVQKAMIAILFPRSPLDEIAAEYKDYDWIKQPEPIWQFCRQRYLWAKDQWPNLSDRITTIWTLQELGLVSIELDVETVIAVNQHHTDLRAVKIQTHVPDQQQPSTEEPSDPNPDAEEDPPTPEE